MIDIKAFLETEFTGGLSSKGLSLRERILRAISKEGGEITIGILFNRLRTFDREDLRDELQRMHDCGRVSVTPYVGAKNVKTLVIRLADKA